MHTVSIGFAFSIRDESTSVAGARWGIEVSNLGFSEPSHTWLLPGQEALCGMCNLRGNMSRHSRRSSNVVRAETATWWSICDLKRAGILNSAVQYFISLPQKESAASPYSGSLNWWSFICFWHHLVMLCWTVLDVVPITHPGSSYSHSLPSLDSSSFSSSPCSPSLECAISLRLPQIGTIILGNNFSGYVVVNLQFSGVSVTSFSCLIAASAA